MMEQELQKPKDNQLRPVHMLSQSPISSVKAKANYLFCKIVAFLTAFLSIQAATIIDLINTRE